MSGAEVDWSQISFHDAEVIAVRIDRKSLALELDVDLVAGTVGSEAPTLVFESISNLELLGFNERNVLFDLLSKRQSDGTLAVDLQSSYGRHLECSVTRAFVRGLTG